jgi:hypothetical protein
MPRIRCLPSKCRGNAWVFLFHGTLEYHQIHYLIGLWWLCYWGDSGQSVWISVGLDSWSLFGILLWLLQQWPFLLYHFLRRSSSYWEGRLAVWDPKVWQLSLSVFFAIFCYKIFLIMLVQGIRINPIIQNRIVHFVIMIFNFFSVDLNYSSYFNLKLNLDLCIW